MRHVIIAQEDQTSTMHDADKNMLNVYTHPHSTTIANEIGTDELLRNLRRFPSAVLPFGVLRELQSRGDAIHDSLVTLLHEAIDSDDGSPGSSSNSAFFPFALFVPIATYKDRPLIESLLKLPDRSIHEILGDLVSEAMPHLIARFFRDQSASEVIDWINRLADYPSLSNFNTFPLFRAMTLAVTIGSLDRTTAIDALTERLKKRADQRFDQQSAELVCELMDLSAHNMEAVDTVVRSSFRRDQIDTDYVDINSWDNIDSHGKFRGDQQTWTDPAEELSSWCYDYLSDDLDPVNATFRVNEQDGRGPRSKKPSIPALIDQLRQSNDQHFPRDAVHSIDRAFSTAYHAVIDLIRDELARFQSDSKGWSGNGAYLGLVLIIANQMPLPTDLLETILRMPQTDREQVFGDQFGLIVQAVALTPLQQYDFVEQWIWDADRSPAERSEMIDFYWNAQYYGFLDREVAIEALVSGLRRALLEAPALIAHYAENLVLFAPAEYPQVLEEAFQSADIEWHVPLQALRRMLHDAEFLKHMCEERHSSYRSVDTIISDGVMFDKVVPPQQTPKAPRTAPTLQLQPEVLSSDTIRNNARTPRNALCPCGSGKKFKKCCLNR